MSDTSDKARTAEREALRDLIDALSNAPNLDALLTEESAIRERILSAWPELIEEDEHSDWLDKLKIASRRRQRELSSQDPTVLIINPPS
ncbi:hypothetical protein [Pseudomonas bubulae]|uniref:hypothetical protein n=1 Tax=Pseudomonas bubulae TaxID=2316085 RepID=UPI001F39BB21|nr:hypothetical protein [Pseudomonas bubulae]MCF3195047.1 hypothetical protein [Pseudomonas bubulae]